VPAEVAQEVTVRILRAAGCPADIAAEVAGHLVDASLCGVESHGLMRVLQYDEQFRSGAMDPAARPALRRTARGVEEVSGQGGSGIPAMRLAVSHACARAREAGIAAVPLREVGHTGRLGAFAEAGALEGCVVIITGGGGRQAWRQVAPHGGRRAVLPTNPWCIASPGGARGPVVADFATGMVAGGWLYAARSAGARLPEGMIIDAAGRPTTDPEDYFAGGAILPRGGPMGYGLAVMGEMICEAMLGPVTTEVNWLVLALDATRHRTPEAMAAVAEEILAELRACPPAEGVAAVEVPGERERDRRAAALRDGIAVPARTWEQILARAAAVDG
jgi:LDH2 family malate/lactate/ureidoglycolate dehydrogenase